MLEELLRCPSDLGPLMRERTSAGLRCSTCGNSYPVQDGIAQLLDTLHPESRKEQGLLYVEARERGVPATDLEDDFMGVEATVAALDVRESHRVLEFGCGTGRFTSILAG